MSKRRTKELGFDENVARYRQAWHDWEKHWDGLEIKVASFSEERAFDVAFQIKERLIEEVRSTYSGYIASAYDLRWQEACLYAQSQGLAVRLCLEAMSKQGWTWRKTLLETVKLLHSLGNERYSRIYALLDNLLGLREEEKARLVGWASAKWKLFDKDKQAFRILETDKNFELLASLKPLYDLNPTVEINEQEVPVEFPLLRTDAKATAAWQRLGKDAGNDLRERARKALGTSQHEVAASQLSDDEQATPLDMAADLTADPYLILEAQEAHAEVRARLDALGLSERQSRAIILDAHGFSRDQVAQMMSVGIRTVDEHLIRGREKINAMLPKNP